MAGSVGHQAVAAAHSVALTVRCVAGAHRVALSVRCVAGADRVALSVPSVAGAHSVALSARDYPAATNKLRNEHQTIVPAASFAIIAPDDAATCGSGPGE
jgi:hypothetical protein